MRLPAGHRLNPAVQDYNLRDYNLNLDYNFASLT